MTELRQARLESSEWSKTFIYDESSPSCLLWNPARSYKGRKTRRDGKLAGSFCTGIRQRYWRVNVKVNGKYKGVMAHRVVWEMHNFEIPEGFEIDHLDGDGSNNKIENLRCVPVVVNKRNRATAFNNKHGMSGISITDNGDGGHKYATASWTEDGKRRSKRFSIAKLGQDEAIRLAKEYRKVKIHELNERGCGYTKRHTEEGEPPNLWKR